MTLINEILCILRLNSNVYNISIICAYSLTEDDTDGVRGLFYDHLDKAYTKFLANDSKLVLEDL